MTESIAPVRPSRGLIWPALVVLLLGGQATMLTLVVLVATRDPSHSVEPNYYEKGLAWDWTRATFRDPISDGIKLLISIMPPSKLLGPESVSMTLMNADGEPVVPSVIEGFMFHHARASERVPLIMTSATSGTFASEVPLQREGIWEVQLSFVFNQQQYTTSTTVEYSRATRD